MTLLHGPAVAAAERLCDAAEALAIEHGALAAHPLLIDAQDSAALLEGRF